MKKTATFFKVHLALLFFSLVIILSCNNNQTLQPKGKKVKTEEGKDMYSEAAMRLQMEFDRTKDPALGIVPKERLIDAYNAAEQSKRIAMRSRITSGTWIERGPYGDEVGMNNGNIRDGWATITSGRLKAMWVDLADATGNTVWVGGVGGGLWKTTNFKDYPAIWTPVNDFFTNMAVGTICQDPTDPNIMYFGTGERTFNTDAIRGGGIWKSTDHGLNWTLLTATTAFYNITKLLCDAAGNLYAGTIQSNTSGGANGALLRSTNGGSSFTNISPSGIDTRVTDFVISSTGRFHVATGYYNSTTSGYRFTDAPSTVTSASWTTSSNPSSNWLPTSSTLNQNCILAVNGNTLYAVISNNSWVVPAIYKSTNGGASWAQTATSPPNTGNTAFSNGQAWYCLSVDVNPTNANQVIVGSLNCYASTDGGATWTQRSDWVAGVGATGQYVHADIQSIKWAANDQLLIGTDGGVFYSADQGMTFEDRNNGLNIKQFYSCAFHPTLTNYFLAGSQDNGCHQFTTPGLNFTTEVSGGDGSYVHIDQNQSSYQFCSYIRNRYRRSVNGGDNWSAVNFYKGTSASPVDFGTFINPTDYDNTTNIMYCGADAGEFFRWTTAQTTPAGSYYNTTGFPTGANIISISNLTGTVTALTVSPHTANRLYLGTGSSKIIRIDNANTIASGSAGVDISGSTFPAGSTISCIAVGNNDDNLMVVFSNYGINNIWVTSNGTAATPTWTAVDGNLPDMPVRWAVYDPAATTKAWIATETGVWSTAALSAGTTVWTASPGFPTVRTDMIKYKSSDQNLVAATHGRGLWTQSLASTLPINTFVLRGKWSSNGSVSLTWDYSNSSSASGFEVETSTNGTYFTKAASTQLNTNYSHQPLASDIYYRVKGKNIFGNISYSNVINLKKGEETKDIAGLRLYPNPVKNYMKISFSASGKGLINYQVASINGQVSWNKNEELTSTGEYIREWDMQHLKPGTYILTVIYNNKKITQKFSKL